jgi:hypothetical protein
MRIYRLGDKQGMMKHEALFKPFNADKFIFGGQFHFKITFDALLGQKRLNPTRWKSDSPAIVGDDRNIFGNTLIDFKILVV